MGRLWIRCRLRRRPGPRPRARRTAATRPTPARACRPPDSGGVGRVTAAASLAGQAGRSRSFGTGNQGPSPTRETVMNIFHAHAAGRRLRRSIAVAGWRSSPQSSRWSRPRCRPAPLPASPSNSPQETPTSSCSTSTARQAAPVPPDRLGGGRGREPVLHLQTGRQLLRDRQRLQPDVPVRRRVRRRRDLPDALRQTTCRRSCGRPACPPTAPSFTGSRTRSAASTWTWTATAPRRARRSSSGTGTAAATSASPTSSTSRPGSGPRRAHLPDAGAIGRDHEARGGRDGHPAAVPSSV